MRKVFVDPVVLPDARFRDGLGIRYVRLEGADEVVEVFRPLDDLAAHRTAIQQRVNRLTSFRQVRFVPLRRADVVHDSAGTLEILSDFVPGHRLSDVLEAAAAGAIAITACAAIHIVREVLGALAVLAESRGLTHGAVGPERLLLVPKGRVLVADYVLGGALAQLEYSRGRLWREFRVAAAPGKGGPKLDMASEVVQVAVTAVALLRGRPVGAEEFPDGLLDLVASLGRSRSGSRGEAVPGALLTWLRRALHLDAGSRLTSVSEARLALETALSKQAVASGGAAAVRALADDYGRLAGVVDAASAARAAAEAAKRTERERDATLGMPPERSSDAAGPQTAARTVLMPAFTLLPDATIDADGEVVAGASFVEHAGDGGQTDPPVGWRVPERASPDVATVVGPLLDRTATPRLPRDAEFPEEIIDLDALTEPEGAATAPVPAPTSPPPIEAGRSADDSSVGDERAAPRTVDIAALEAEPEIAACFLNEEDRPVARDLTPVDTMPALTPLPLQEIDLSVVETEPAVAALFQPEPIAGAAREAAPVEEPAPVAQPEAVAVLAIESEAAVEQALVVEVLGSSMADSFRSEASILVVPDPNAGNAAAAANADSAPGSEQALPAPSKPDALPRLPSDWLIDLDVASRRRHRRPEPERPALGVTIELPELVGSFAAGASQSDVPPPPLTPRRRLGVAPLDAPGVAEEQIEVAAAAHQPLPQEGLPPVPLARVGPQVDGAGDSATDVEQSPAEATKGEAGPVFPRVAPSVRRVREEARRRRLARARAALAGSAVLAARAAHAAGAAMVSAGTSAGRALRAAWGAAAWVGASVGRGLIRVAASSVRLVGTFAAGLAGLAVTGLSAGGRAVVVSAAAVVRGVTAGARGAVAAAGALGRGAAAVGAAAASGARRAGRGAASSAIRLGHACALAVRWSARALNRSGVAIGRAGAGAVRGVASAAGSAAQRAASMARAARPRRTVDRPGAFTWWDLPRRAGFLLSDLSDRLPRARVRLSYVAAALTLIVGVVGAPYVKDRWFTPAPPSGTLRVESSRAGLTVRVDGADLGPAPLTAAVPVGTHRVEVTGDGRIRVQDVAVVEGQTVVIEAGSRDLRATGSLRIDTDPPGASVWVDGVAHGTAPVTIGALAEGAHSVVVRNAAGSVRRSVAVRPDETAEAVVAIRPGWLAVFAPVRLEILEGGQPIGSTEGGRLLASPGDHTIEAVSRTLGYRSSHRVEVRPGEVTALTIALPPAALEIVAPPGSEIRVDGTLVGNAPLGTIQVPVGTRVVQARHRDFGDRRQSVTVTYTKAARAIFP